MCDDELAVLRPIVEFVRTSDYILELKVVREFSPDVVKALQQELASDQKLRTIWVIPTEDDVGITIVRAEATSNMQFSVATEKKLKNVGKIVKRGSSHHFFCNVRTVAKRIAAQGGWCFWSIGKTTADQKHIPPECTYNKGALIRRRKLSAYRHFNSLVVWLSVTEPRITIIHGRADSGKRTEIVHHLLEKARTTEQSCRMIYVMQEEVEVLATAVRICDERNETIGGIIGCKLNVNTQVSEMNHVVFCTTQTLIVSLLSKTFETALGMLTHLIVDCGDRHPNEINLLLSLVKGILHDHVSIKLVLLSSRDGEPSPFGELFTDALVMRIPCSETAIHYPPDKPDGVQYSYLDDILESICTYVPIVSMKQKLPRTKNALKLMADLQRAYSFYSHNQNVTEIMDMLLGRCWFADDAEPFTTVLLRFLDCNRHMVDYQHSNTRLTALMIAAAKGFIDVVKSLLDMGANPYLVGRKSLKAMDWCYARNDNPCWQMMNTAHKAYEDVASKRSLLCQLYHKLYNPFVVDQLLVGDIVRHICQTCVPGTILVVLPDFSDVLDCYELLRSREFKSRRQTLQFVVYHRLLTEEEIRENEQLPPKRSELHVVILVAGPLLELVASLTRIDYVVDTGLVAHRSGDYAKGVCLDRSCLATAQRSRFLMWLAQQKCFMLYTKDCMSGEYAKPPTRPVPNVAESEAVLKALACRTASSTGTSLEYVCSTLFANCSTSMMVSLQMLTRIGAIEKSLSVPTNLGLLLIHLGVGVHLGKALLYSILFRCLDPMITIVAALKVGDPFIEPLNEDEQREIIHLKQTLHHRTYSDCMVLLRLYQQWSQCKTKQTDHLLVQNYRLKPGAMEAISNARVELMSVLRVLGIVKCGRKHNTEKLNINAGNFHMVKGCLAAGLYPQLAVANYSTKLLSSNCGTEIFKPHPLSVAQVDMLPAKWVIYHRKQDHMLIVPQAEAESSAQNVKDVQVQIMDNTVISEATLLLMCGIDRIDTLNTGNLQTRGPTDGKEQVEFIIDQKYLFQLPQSSFKAVSFIRRRLGRLFHDFTRNLLQTIERKDTDVLVNFVGDVLNAEDLGLMLTSPNIETRPRIRNLLPMGVFWNYTFDMFQQAELRDQPVLRGTVRDVSVVAHR